MDQRTMPSARLTPLPPEHSPELQDQFEAMRKNLGFIPNSILIMQRLINASLVRAKRAPALKHQYHLTWKRWGCLRAISHDVHPSSRVPPEGT